MEEEFHGEPPSISFQEAVGAFSIACIEHAIANGKELDTVTVLLSAGDEVQEIVLGFDQDVQEAKKSAVLSMLAGLRKLGEDLGLKIDLITADQIAALKRNSIRTRPPINHSSTRPRRRP